MLLGNQYGPNGAGQAMPARLRSWPWTNTKLISYSARGGATVSGDAAAKINWSGQVIVGIRDVLSRPIQ